LIERYAEIQDFGLFKSWYKPTVQAEYMHGSGLGIALEGIKLDGGLPHDIFNSFLTCSSVQWVSNSMSGSEFGSISQ